MSLLQDFYTVVDLRTQGQKVLATIAINSAHPVFEGHFPNHPVTPGVCMMQIIKELAEKHVGHTLLLKKARNVKFMAIINPTLHPNIEVELDIEEADGLINVKSTTSFGETIALKFSGIFQNV